MPTIDQARAWYPSQDPVHGFDHVLRVLGTAEWLGGGGGGGGGGAGGAGRRAPPPPRAPPPVRPGQPICAEPSQTFRANGTAEAGEPHSAYHEYLFKLRRVGERLHTDPARALALQRHDLLVRFFDALAEEAKGPRP